MFFDVDEGRGVDVDLLILAAPALRGDEFAHGAGEAAETDERGERGDEWRKANQSNQQGGERAEEEAGENPTANGADDAKGADGDQPFIVRLGKEHQNECASRRAE